MTTNTNKIGVHNKKYIDKFYSPNFTAYDFLTLLSSLYASNKEYSFDRDILVKFIGYCKSNSKFIDLLNNINLKSNGVSYYSEEFDEAITKLKWARILYTISPESDSIIYIFKNIPIADLVNSRQRYIDEMINFIDEYKTFIIKTTNKKYNCSLTFKKNTK